MVGNGWNEERTLTCVAQARADPGHGLFYPVVTDTNRQTQPPTSMPSACGTQRKPWRVTPRQVFVVVALVLVALVGSRLTGQRETYEGRPVAFWLRAACGPDHDIRLRANQALAEIGPEAIPALKRALGTVDNSLGNQLRMLLARAFPTFQRPTIPAARIRERAARCLDRFGPRAIEAAPDLVAQLEDADPDAMVAARSALKSVGPAALPAVTYRLSLKPPQVRRESAALIGALAGASQKPNRWTSYLAELAEDPEIDVRVSATRALGRMAKQRPAALAPLRKLAIDPAPAVRRETMIALAELGPKAAALEDVMRDGLADADHEASLRAASALWHATGDARAALPPLIEGLGMPGVRWLAALILGEIGTEAEPAIPALLDAMTREVVHRPGRTPACAAQALARVGPRAVPGLVKLLDHRDLSVRASAAHALAGQGSLAAPAVPGLCRLLSEAHGEIGVLACQALGAIGPAAREAVPQLLELSETRTGYMQAASLGALSLIGLPGEPGIRITEGQ